MDVGVADLAVCSDGRRFNNPRMTKKYAKKLGKAQRKLAKHLHDANFGEILRQLEYKADWYGRKISAVDQWFPSSKMCNACGLLYSGKWTLAIRKWACSCGTSHDRDHNAAINIHKEGLRIAV